MRFPPATAAACLVLATACSTRVSENGSGQSIAEGGVDGAETDDDGGTDGAGDGDGDGDGSTEGGDDLTGWVDAGSDSGTCDPYFQDCPDGDKCTYVQTGAETYDSTRCVPVTGSDPPGTPCRSDGPLAGTDSCDATSMCWDLVESAEGLSGVCAAFCIGNVFDPDCPVDHFCDTRDAIVDICRPSCDPLDQRCPEGEGCYWTSSTFECVATSQNFPPGAACGYVNDCEPGSTCLSADRLGSCDGAGCCSPFCDLEAADPCAQFQAYAACTPWFTEDEPLPGLAHVGVCTVAP